MAQNLTDSLSKLLSLMGVIPGHVARRLHQPQRPARQDEPLQVQSAHEDVHALVPRTEHVLGRDAAVLEDQLAGARPPDAQFVKFGT